MSEQVIDMNPVVRLCAGIRRRYRDETGLPGDEFWDVAQWYAAHDYLVDKDELRRECEASESDFENLCTAFTLPPGKNPMPSFWPCVLLDGRPGLTTQLDFVRVTVQLGWEDGHVSMFRAEVPVLPDESCGDWTDGLVSRTLRFLTSDMINKIDGIGLNRVHDEFSTDYGSREDFEGFKQSLARLSRAAQDGEAPSHYSALAAAAAELCRPHASTPEHGAEHVTRLRARLKRSRAERRAAAVPAEGAAEPVGMVQQARRVAARVREMNSEEQAGALDALAASNATLHALVRRELARLAADDPV